MFLPLFLIFFSCFLSRTWSSTIVISKCNDGIVIGADSLSVGSGSLVNSRVACHVHRLVGADTIVCCASSSGGLSDFTHLLTELQRYVRSTRQNDVTNSVIGTKRTNYISTSALTRYARRLITHKYRKAHVVIAGADYLSTGKKDDNGGKIDGCQYSIHEIIPGGSHVQHKDFVVAGSGSDLVFALLHSMFNNNNSPDSTKPQLPTTNDCATMVQRALKSAATVDPRTGAGERVNDRLVASSIPAFDMTVVLLYSVVLMCVCSHRAVFVDVQCWYYLSWATTTGGVQLIS